MNDSPMKLLHDIIADLDLRARSRGDVEDGQAVLDLSGGLVNRYYYLKETQGGTVCVPHSAQDERQQHLPLTDAGQTLPLMIGPDMVELPKAAWDHILKLRMQLEAATGKSIDWSRA